MSRVRRLPRDPGRSGWNALLPPPPAARELDGARTADWLVIGAGFAGLAAARRLSQLRPGASIAVLEASRVGEGPAGRNSGFMIDLPHRLTSEDYAGDLADDRARIALNRAGIDFAAQAAADYGLSEEALARSGKVNGAASERGMQQNHAYAAHLDRLGEPHEMLDADAMKRLTGSGWHLGGVRTPGAAVIQPAMFVRGVAAGLEASGAARIHELSPVTALERSDGEWTATTPGGSVTAACVILAVNGHAESFGHFRRRLVHVHLYASMTRALTPDEVARLGGAPRWGVTPADPIGATVRRISGTGGDRIVVRNRVTYDPDLTCDEARLPRMGRSQEASFRARFPMLPDVGMEHRWGGRLCLSLNDVPAFGEIGDGLYAACCQNGLGTARGTASGMLAAEFATGEEGPLLSRMLSLDPPKKLPPAPFAWLGATATVRWREWRAGREM